MPETVDLTDVPLEQRLGRIINAKPGTRFTEQKIGGGYVESLDGHPPGSGLIEYRSAAGSIVDYRRRLDLLTWRSRSLDRLEWLSRGGR